MEGSSQGRQTSPDDLSSLVTLDRFVSALTRFDVDGTMLSKDSERIPTHESIPFCEALTTGYTDDRHFVLYMASRAAATVRNLPRLSRRSIVPMREAGIVDEVYGVALALDYDLVPRGSWTQALMEQHAALFERITEVCPWLAHPTLFYATQGGFRLVYALNEPIPLQGLGGIEDRLLGMIYAAYSAGLLVDTSCTDWTRLFRLPCVYRQHVHKGPRAPTWEQPYFRMSWGRVDFTAKEFQPPEAPLAYAPDAFRRGSAWKRSELETSGIAAKLPRTLVERAGREPLTEDKRFAEIPVGDMPGNEELETAAAGKENEYKRIKSALQGRMGKNGKAGADVRRLYDILYKSAPLCPANKDLHGSMKWAAGFLAHLLSDAEVYYTAQHIFALLVRSAQRAAEQRPDRHQDVMRELWDLVVYCYQAQACDITDAQGNEQAQAEELDRRRSQEQHLFGDEATQIVRFYEQLEPNLEPASMLPDAKRFHILSHEGFGHFVLQKSPNGSIRLSHEVKTYSGLVTACRDSGFAGLRISKPPQNPLDIDGTIKREVELAAEYSTPVSAVVLSRIVPTNTVRLDPERGQLEVIKALPGFSLEGEAAHDPEVEQWLKLMCGDQFERVCDWIAALPKLDKPCAALIFEGGPSSGKSMFGEAIRHFTATKSAVDFSEYFSSFHEGFLASPFVWGDEGMNLPRRRDIESVANLLKKMISGDSMWVNIKGRSKVKIEGSSRILLTVNNLDHLRLREDVSEADVESFTKRLLIVRVPDDAAALYLKQLGGRPYTHDWPSLRILKHFRHLVRTHAYVPGDRFEVEGVRTEAHEAMVTNSDTAMLLCQAIGDILSKRPSAAEVQARKIVRILHGSTVITDLDRGRVLANGPGLRAYIIEHFKEVRNVPTLRNVIQALRSLAKSKEQVQMHLDSSGYVAHGEENRSAHPRCYDLNLTSVLRCLRDMGADYQFGRQLGELFFRNCPGEDATSRLAKGAGAGG